jgi:rare lipoprotein A
MLALQQAKLRSYAGPLPAAAKALLCAALAAALSAQDPASQQGLASWYGGVHDGRTAASGEVFDSQALTAAHRTLPFGTKVRVRRLDSDESVVVRINDRGPFAGSRIIDVSQAAAYRLGMREPGVARVSVEVVEGPPAAAPAEDVVFAVQAGTFRNPDNAARTRDALERRYGTARVVVWRGAPQFRCVLVGEAATAEEAGRLAGAIRAGDKGLSGAYVVRLDRTVLSFAD